MTVALLGATGAVGAVAADRLIRAGIDLRLGGRRPDVLADAAASLGRLGGGAVEVMQVDLHDDAALRAFVAGADVVANTAGPSYRVLDRVALYARDAGAHYVDAAGDTVALEALAQHGGWTDSTSAVFSAGLMPGLTGLLPRLLIDDAHPAQRLDVYVGGSVGIGALSAVDALTTRGDGFGTGGAMVRQSQVVPNALLPLHGVRLPGFPGPVHAWPFLTDEMVALATDLDIAEVRSFTVYRSARIADALTHAWAEPADEAGNIARIVAAADADVAQFGRDYALLLQTRSPHGAGRLLLRLQDSYSLSGVVVAQVATQLLAGRIAPGAGTLPRLADPAQMLEALRGDPQVHELTVTGPHWVTTA